MLLTLEEARLGVPGEITASTLSLCIAKEVSASHFCDLSSERMVSKYYGYN